MSVDALVKHLQLLPHPEGGYYREIYRSAAIVPQQALPKGFTGDRHFSTSIYFLIEKNNFSALHRIKSDEVWHFYAGDALEVIEITDDGKLTITCVGNQLESGEHYQYTVKANTWFGSRVKSGGEFSLVGCTVSPGFDFADFEMAERNDLIAQFPEHSQIILELTR